MTALRSLIFLGLALCLGCGSEHSPADKSSNNAQGRLTLHQDGLEAGGGAQAPLEDAQPRKIIYTAKLELIVDDLDVAEKEINQLLEDLGGHVAKSEVHGAPGSPRWGSWTVRVPVDHFAAFKEAAGKLGELRSGNTDSGDITDKYYDLKAHLKNDQVAEEALQKLLLERPAGGKLEDHLAIRRELRTLRGEIEQQLAQMKRWDKETALATITLNVHDRKDYVPPAAPGLRASIGRTWEGSLDALQTFGRGVVLTAVAILPWLPVLALVIVPGVLLSRRWKAKVKAG